MADSGKTTAADLWSHTLGQIPSEFGRLVYLTSLRDQNTGRYKHHAMSQVFGDEEVDQALRDSHRRTFADWLCLSLQQQKSDLELYLSSFQTDKATILSTWIKLSPYQSLMPLDAREPERRLYLGDLEAILELLKNEYDVVPPEPDE